MYKIMKHYGLPQKVVNVIRNSYEGFKCCVKTEGEKGQMFDVKIGVRQGDVWSPILFGLVINYVLANSVQGGIDIGRCVADLDFADDVALLGVSDSEVQANLHRIESLAEAVGLMINVGKTKNMGVKCFDTARGCKVHEARFYKSKNSKRVEDSASKFVGLEKSLTCQKCTRKFATVKGRRIHESRYCGREKAGRSRIFSCNVQMEWSSKM